MGKVQVKKDNLLNQKKKRAHKKDGSSNQLSKACQSTCMKHCCTNKEVPVVEEEAPTLC